MSADVTNAEDEASSASPDGNDDRLISLPGRSPVLDAAQLGVLRTYGSERDVSAADVLFADGDVTYDLVVLLAGPADIIEGYSQPGGHRQLRSVGVSRRDRHAHRAACLPERGHHLCGTGSGSSGHAVAPGYGAGAKAERPHLADLRSGGGSVTEHRPVLLG